MIEQARAALSADGLPSEQKVLIQGFSASGMFANRFTALHPERVRAATVGSPGGWPIVPVARMGDDTLDYPAGIADLQSLTGHAFDSAAFAAVPQLFIMGSLDDNDSVDHEDGWDKRAALQLERLFGTTPAARWPHAAAAYRRAGARAEFTLVQGIGHDRKALQDRSTAFFHTVLRR
jgi:pimeloyl-ACP methyl ester carboxylesterase